MTNRIQATWIALLVFFAQLSIAQDYETLQGYREQAKARYGVSYGFGLNFMELRR